MRFDQLAPVSSPVPVPAPLTPRATVAEVEQWCVAHGIRLQPAVNGPAYAVDAHFAGAAFTTIATLEDAEAFVRELERDAATRDRSCAKARTLRTDFATPFWIASPSRLRSALSHARRIMCGCHETGCYAPRPVR